MDVQIVSDLHLEAPKAYDVFEISPHAPTLALLGDIGNIVAHKGECRAFLIRQFQNFRTVLFVPGNHEAYHSSWPETISLLRDFEQEFGQDDSIGEFVLLDRTAYRVPDSNTVILGCSLFSLVPPESEMQVSMGLNDFFQTSDWDVQAHNNAHNRDVAWLNAQVLELENSDVEVILSHWNPSRDERSIDPRFAQSPITSGFATDLSVQLCFRSKKVKIWAFGHTHYNCDFTVERGGDAEPLRLIANQRGYYFSQAAGFEREKVIDV
ncbi:calcineurin-like phosphoesterase [Colletotrichum godetiae]|uniref:Calcineurin-like phosphoesterase n=1 Tax=Colletotrichum godetiae TaxID=1209918 RepID=A0AAJ0ANV2_9PEZI|nr:calcineurin-like phosphoesterase [Colletotrichum godetiae]KAK1687648.1 calcineurin-like phosphoesterase [Colletotrichum godetiae]